MLLVSTEHSSTTLLQTTDTQTCVVPVTEIPGMIFIRLDPTMTSE
jgi:hypothetical protein